MFFFIFYLENLSFIVILIFEIVNMHPKKTKKNEEIIVNSFIQIKHKIRSVFKSW